MTAPYPKRIDTTMCDRYRRAVFVFGSNLLGIHGKGAALYAAETRGAINGQGVGLSGQSYALPTKRVPPGKGRREELMPFDEVREHVQDFLRFAADHQDTDFAVTRVGCGLSGFSDDHIAPLFLNAPSNCMLPGTWERRRQPNLCRLIIAGSRDLEDAEGAYACLDTWASKIRHLDLQIVCGAARGADRLGFEWAARNSLPTHCFPAEWEKKNYRRPGPERNQEMSWFGTHLAALKFGDTPGTGNMIETATTDGLFIRIANWKDAPSYSNKMLKL